MKTIIALNFSHMKNPQHFNFADFVKAAITLYALADGKYSKFINKFLAAFAAEDEAYQKYDRKTLSDRIAKQNAVRQVKIRLLRDVIDAFCRTADGQSKLAAERLMGAINLYGGVKIPTLPMDSLTGVLTNLIEDFHDKYAEDVELLGIGGQIENLKAANEEFKQLISERTQADSEIGKEAMALARTETDRTLRMLFTAINLDVEFGDADPELEPFIAYLNTEINRYRIQVGQGVAGSTGSGGDTEDEEGVRMKTATFKFHNGDSVKLKVEVGTILTAPTNTEGYKWKPEVPEFMPAKNCTFREVAIVEEEVTATFHFFDHREEEIRQLVGSILHAPANTEGYVWDPEVPATMPAENTAYYEMPATVIEPTLYTIAFEHNGNTVASYELEAGATVTAPEAPSGYHWVNVPATMPAENVTITTEEDEEEEPPILS